MAFPQRKLALHRIRKTLYNTLQLKTKLNPQTAQNAIPYQTKVIKL